MHLFFKNLTLYRLREQLTLSPEDIHEKLGAAAFKPCGGLEPFSYGFEPPLGRNATALTHAANGRIMVCARREERLLPGTVVKEAVEDRVAQIESAEFRTVFRKERQRIRDEVTFEMLPRAFTKNARTYAYVCPEDGWLVVDASTLPKAELFVTALAEAVPALDILPYSPDQAVSQLLTRWLRDGELPSGLALLDECEMRDPAQEGSLVRCQRQEMVSDEIRAHLKAKKEVRRLGLGFEDQLTFALTAEMQIKRLRFENVKELDDLAEGDEAARFDADFAFMTATLAPLLRRFLQVFGEVG
ncbi:MAG: recombination associated protein RdgC [Gammaproteobacteria bacterium]